MAKSFSNYQLGDCIGKGAFGSVYRGLNLETGEVVAIKQIKLNGYDKSQLNSLTTEIDLLKKLQHPNIVKYLGSMRTKEYLHIILEFCESGSLCSHLKKFGKFPETLCAVYITQVLEGLVFLHDQGVIHRDIKGANILTTKDGLVKLADFGVATRLAENKDDAVVGSPYWMAPEVIELTGASTPSDIWSVGCTVIELLTGNPPYHGLAAMAALFRIVQDDHPPVPETVSATVKDFLLQCFQKDPNLRVTAKKLLKHPWISGVKRRESKSDKVMRPKETNLDRSAHLTPKPSIKSPTRKVENSLPSPDQDIENWDDDFADGIPSINSKRRAPPLPPKPQALPKQVDSSQGDRTIKASKQNVQSKSPTTSATSPKPSTNRQTSSPLLRHAEGEDTDNWDDDFENFSPKNIAKQNENAVPSRVQNSRGQSTSQEQNSKIVKSLSDLNNFVEEDDDFSDVINGNESLLIKKLKGLGQPQPTRSRSSSQSRVAAIPSSATPKSTTRSRSSSQSQSQTPRNPSIGSQPKQLKESLSKISQYTENEEKDNYDDDFMGPGSNEFSESTTPKASASQFPRSESAVSKITGTDDSDDDADPFDDVEFEEQDSEAEFQRDQVARVTAEIVKHVGNLRTGVDERVVVESCERLCSIFEGQPEMKSKMIAYHGVTAVTELLEITKSTKVLESLLTLIHKTIIDTPSVLETICLVGGIPTLINFTSRSYNKTIRLLSVNIIQFITSDKVLLRMFIACKGLQCLVGLLDEKYEEGKELVWCAIDCVVSVFELQGSTPKNDFCRLFAKHGLLPLLASSMRYVNRDKEDASVEYLPKIVNLFLIFSQGDEYVRGCLCQWSVLKVLLDELDYLNTLQIVVVLKCIKHISMDSSTLETLQKAGTIQKLVGLLDRKTGPYVTETYNQILTTLFNLCKLSKERQEIACKAGLIPHLKYIIHSSTIPTSSPSSSIATTDSSSQPRKPSSNFLPLRQLALPIFCELVHAKSLRSMLWSENCLEIYCSLLRDTYWMGTALESVCVWLIEETTKVEPILLNHTEDLILLFITSKTSIFNTILEPFLKILTRSVSIGVSLFKSREFVERIVDKLSSPIPLVRVGLLKMLMEGVRAASGASGEKKEKIAEVDKVKARLQIVMSNESSVFAKELCTQLITELES
ncbi:hypothetical protein BKA69DRAFT_1065643 [Paraphysoderma sedebokerense]|nr:hypothetical protein BKA69DRAFT_1065643 [Paraphysoderma sedebokerense]